MNNGKANRVDAPEVSALSTLEELSASGSSSPTLKRRLIKALRDLLETVIPAVVIALLINMFLAQATRVYGQSMEPNLHTSQRLVIEKVSYWFHGPRRGDIVVLKIPEQGSEPLIKRVIGLPGETVAIHDGLVYIDGQPLKEPYLDRPTPGQMPETVVPPLHVFVLGDNRAHSNDSRAFGPVPRRYIIGRAWLSYWPPQNIGLVQ